MYKITISTINENADGPFFNKWLKDNYPLYLGYSFSNEVVMHFESVIDAASHTIIEDKYQSLTDSDVLVSENNKYNYYLKSLDGGEWYSNLRANWYQEYLDGLITIEEEHYRQTKIKSVKEFIILGDWLDAQYEVNNIIDGGLVGQQDIDNSYTQELHDGIKSSIDLYVTNNY